MFVVSGTYLSLYPGTQGFFLSGTKGFVPLSGITLRIALFLNPLLNPFFYGYLSISYHPSSSLANYLPYLLSLSELLSM